MPDRIIATVVTEEYGGSIQPEPSITAEVITL